MNRPQYLIVGMRYRGMEDFVKGLPAGEPLVLAREPDNKYDFRAVQVWARGKMVGYISKEQNFALSKFIDNEGRQWTAPLEPIEIGPTNTIPDQTITILKAIDATFRHGDDGPMAEV